MKKRFVKSFKIVSTNSHFRFVIVSSFLLFALFFSFPEFFSSAETYRKGEKADSAFSNFVDKIFPPEVAVLDAVLYDEKMIELANNPPPKPPTTKIVKDPTTGVETTITVEPKPILYKWPVKTVYPNVGAILPFNRIIAYYGNLYSRKMGVLGEYDEDIMLAKLDAEVKKWEVADPTTPVMPALHYIAVVAQGSAGADGKYRARMPDAEIDKVLKIAEKINAIVFLDVQVGFSTLEDEVPRLEKYLKMPNVHLGIDAEFSMKNGVRPGKVVGTFDAKDINFAANYLAKVVKENNLTPKILVVHRYTQKMITNYQNITPLPEVQIVMHMDGWGGAAKKIGTYKNFIYPEPVQFAGFKLFYKNDILTPGTTLMTPGDLMKLNPRPIYIQYQ
jgi:hypothetical protein